MILISLFHALFLHMTMVTVDSNWGGLNEKGPHKLLRVKDWVVWPC